MLYLRRLLCLLQLNLLVKARSLKPSVYADFHSGENDLIPLDNKPQQSATPMPAPVIPEVVIHPTNHFTASALAQDRLILANRLLQSPQAVHSFPLTEDSSTLAAAPLKDPFFEDSSSGQQIPHHQKPDSSPLSTPSNERLLAKQTPRQYAYQATVNEMPLPHLQLPKPIVPEVVVRGSALPDAYLPLPRRFSSCQPY